MIIQGNPDRDLRMVHVHTEAYGNQQFDRSKTRLIPHRHCREGSPPLVTGTVWSQSWQDKRLRRRAMKLTKADRRAERHAR